MIPPGPSSTVDPSEVARFDRLARDWWDPNGPMRALHRLNPVRLQYIRDRACDQFGRDARAPRCLHDLAVLDVGCGAGLLCEPLSRLGAAVIGLDPAPTNIAVARLHAERAGLTIDYRTDTVETVVAGDERFDVVLAMEVVEHVTDVQAFVAACCTAVKPGGLVVMATINRTLRAFALVIIGAEYVLGWLPKGTHQWDKFVTPAELTEAIESSGLSVMNRRGAVYNPITSQWFLAGDMSVNYMLAAAVAPYRPGEPVKRAP